MRIAQLEARLARVEATLAKLEARANANSRNSHRPPSSDPPSAPPRPTKPPTGRSRGGQPGHPQATRPLVPPDQVTTRHVVKPEACGDCGRRLRGTDPAPERRQIVDLPVVEPVVTEYELHALRCRCGAVTRAALPVGAPTSGFGPRLAAFVALATGAYHLSKRGLQALLADTFHLHLGLGTIPKLERTVSAALEAPVAEAHACVQQAPAVNADETSWREAGRKAWLWVAATALVVVFCIRRFRDRASAQALLGLEFAGLLGSDRWASYGWIPLARRQFCWAHLKRDFRAMVEAGGEAGRVGTALLGLRKRVFKWWHRVRDGDLTRATLRNYVDGLRPAFCRWLERGTRSGHTKSVGVCRELLTHELALWTFVRREGIEPTNNDAERALRPAVLWRKGSWGTQSEAGSRFVERMLTTVTTLKRQGRNVHDFVTAACEAAMASRPAPSLLTTSARPRRAVA